jgi:hypothetical protein
MHDIDQTWANLLSMLLCWSMLMLLCTCGGRRYKKKKEADAMRDFGAKVAKETNKRTDEL